MSWPETSATDLTMPLAVDVSQIYLDSLEESLTQSGTSEDVTAVVSADLELRVSLSGV